MCVIASNKSHSERLVWNASEKHHLFKFNVGDFSAAGKYHICLGHNAAVVVEMLLQKSSSRNLNIAQRRTDAVVNMIYYQFPTIKCSFANEIRFNMFALRWLFDNSNADAL